MSKISPAGAVHQRSRRCHARPRTLGPVRNLEEHVPSDWWHRIFNGLYLKTDADVVADSRITAGEVDVVLQCLGLNMQERILDLCCGQGRHSLELARRGCRNVEGLDRSHYLIQRAKERAKEQGLGIKFREGDARKLPFEADDFDVVLVLGNSFGYFETLQDDLGVLREIFRVIKPWGKLLIDIADGQFLKENFQSRSWEWIDKNLFVCRERSLSSDGERLVSREVVTHVAKGVIADQFYAERLYSKESLSEVLQQAGFSEVIFPTVITPASQRAQDLGMMERRIVATAQVRKEWSQPRKKAHAAHKNVVVILGDPRRPDPLKPLCVFDDDDFYTIDKMKEALRELDAYKFTYLSNHDTLMRDLLRMRTRIHLVVNLCDEGFGNDPRSELHVPALLEALGFPYSGAGPQCLAFCYDKSVVRGAAKEMGIPVPQAHFIKPEDSAYELPFDFPVLVKPNFGDSSFGITARSVAYDAEGLINAITGIRNNLGYEKPILVEEFLTGKDLTVGIIGNPPSSYMVLPISEEDYSALPEDLPRICGYEAKWCPDSPYWSIRSVPARLNDSTARALIEWSTMLSERLECRDYTRFDWRLDAEGNPRLLEVNPNPGWCWDGHLAKMAAFTGMTYAEMLAAILRAAEDRLGIGGSEDSPSNG